MSREILFKAKRKDNSDWVEGALFYSCNNKVAYIIIQSKMTEVFDDGMGGFDALGYEVYPETICQYTGLTDENGNKIWENDIAVRRSSQEEFIGKIIYDRNGSLCHREFQADYEVLLIGSERYVTVIGNIFDNKELLEGGE